MTAGQDAADGIRSRLAVIADMVDGLAGVANTVAELDVVRPPMADGADLSRIDWDRPPLQTLTATDGLELEAVVVDGRILPGTARDVHLKDVLATGGSKLPGDPRPIIDASHPACEGWLFDGVTVDPKVPSHLWGEGVRVGRMATIPNLRVRRVIDALGVLTPMGRRTDLDVGWLHFEDPYWSAIDPNHADGSHIDVIQFHGPIDGAKMRRVVADIGPKGTSGIMCNVPSVNDFYLAEAAISGGRDRAAAVNFGPKTKVVTGTLAVVDSLLDCPVGVYCTDELDRVLRLERSMRADGSPAQRRRS